MYLCPVKPYYLIMKKIIKGYHGTDIDSCIEILKSNYKISKGGAL